MAITAFSDQAASTTPAAFSTPEQLAEHLRVDLVKWEKVIKSVGLGAH